MTSYVPADLRRLVKSRANGLCEYCLIHEDDTFLSCQVDHVISEKHGGVTEKHNLANACSFCNRSKGTDIGSIVTSTAEFVRFFNPRSDLWADHFVLQGVRIVPRTTVGEVTAKILALNSTERILEREALQSVGRYPAPEAASMMLLPGS
jgi:hypothetical protein